MLETHDYFKSSQEDNAYFLREVAVATKTGVYSVNFKENKFFVDSIGRSILNIPSSFNPSINDASQLFVDHSDVKKLLQTCLKGDYFEEDIQMQSYTNERIWMRFTGKPRYDKHQEVIGIRGVFTSINKYVRDREELQRHNRVIEAQNQRLLHFAHIVSHNLRSHSSNLELTLELFNDVANEERSRVFYSYLFEISNNLSATLKHLNQVVTVNSEKSASAVIDIRETVEKIMDLYRVDIKEANAQVELDFSRLPFIEYIPSFFENILDTLISNALQYRDDQRRLKISMYSKTKNGKRLFIIKDNGRGIDLDKHGSKIFKLYESIDKVSESKGLGLFLAKNQVEALGGDMVVKSEVDKGTTFIIKF